MSAVLEEMQAILSGELSHDDAELMHYGMPRRSGRFPWGSGEDPYQRGRDFLGRVEELRKTDFTFTDDKGKTWTGDNAIAKSMGLTSTQFRTELAICKSERRQQQVAKAKSLKDKGFGDTEIGRQMGVNESTVRSWLNEKSEARMNQARETANFLKSQVDQKKMVDVGSGVERELNISKEKLNQALYLLQREGYEVYGGGIPQVTNKGQQTNQKVLCVPGTEKKAIYEFDKVHSLNDYITRDDGATFEKKFHYPESLDSKRMMVRYKEDGGIEMDGIVELRPGVADLSLGESRYSQVRIMVDKTHYIKGMAVYADDLPDGVDVRFNTNKSKDVPLHKVLKEIKNDPDNPFGSLIKDADKGGQYWYDPKTGERVSSNHPNAKLGLINKRADQGDWTEWANALPSQFLAKQARPMVKKQLDLAKADKYAEYEEICSLTNPTVKKHLLNKFADGCDAAAVDLKAAALPGQKYHVIVPNGTLKDNECYAPGYDTGTKLALIRYPHGGTFEIPIVTVNNKNQLGKKLIGSDSIDAICINSRVAERLSGADFDGDTVMAIPTHDRAGKVKITSTPPLKGLEGFDPKMEYPEREGMRYMKDPKTGKDSTQMEMGIISNLITDMTLAGAKPEELARAVRHSMVVIDAGKHKLDYKQSEIDNNIAELKRSYQRHVDENGRVHYGGASTILSKSKGEVTIDKRQGSPKINLKGKEWYDPSKPEGSLIYKTNEDLYYPVRKYDKDTGEVTLRTTAGKKVSYKVTDPDAVEKYAPVKNVNKETGEVTYTNKAGDISYKVNTKKQKSTRMAEVDDAYDLVSEAKHPTELLYADYANTMKSLANQARIEMANTGKIKYSATAKSVYAKEVASLNAKLNTAELNKSKERAAQRLANAEIAAKKASDPTMSKKDEKKASQQALTKYRTEVGSVSRRDRSIKITDSEWDAIQAGAVSENILTKILNNTDIDNLRERATPRTSTTLSTSKINQIKSMNDSNYTLSQIAAKLNVSTSTVSKYLKGVN